MDTDLKSLRIDRSRRRQADTPRWAKWWIFTGVALFLLVGLLALIFGRNRGVPVEIMRVQPATLSSSDPDADRVIVLNATGYIVAAHKIQVASKILGRVAWIGVDKGDKVRKDQVLARLEDDEIRAQLAQAKGQLASFEARLRELEAGSRPEEIAAAKANLDEARAELANAETEYNRARQLVAATVAAQQVLDDAIARRDRARARVASLERTYELVRLGPRQEVIDAARGQVEQARGAVAFFESQLRNTIIRAPVTGTILQREVEPGEFVTTSFVGERGAKGFVVTMADLNDLQVELDINQNDFARLKPSHRGIVTTDAYPDRKYEGYIKEIAPEANRQKATVQVKVQIEKPDEYLRPEMNASVAFYEQPTPSAASSSTPVVTIPASALVGGDTVFLALNGKAVARKVKAGGATSQGVRIEDGLIGGEDLIVAPPPGLKDGDAITVKKG